MENDANNGQDDIPDFDQLFSWKKEMIENTNVDLLTGVEIGYVPHQKERLQDIVDSYDFDLRLLSCHQNEKYDYMDKVGEEPKVMINEYLEQLLEALKEMPDC